MSVILSSLSIRAGLFHRVGRRLSARDRTHRIECLTRLVRSSLPLVSLVRSSPKPGLVTVAGKPGDDLAPGTLNSVLKQAGLKP
jgi:hypothetical protein